MKKLLFAKNTTLMFGEVAAGAVLGRYLQTRHGAIRHFWWVPQTALTISHTVGVIHNERRGQGIW